MDRQLGQDFQSVADPHVHDALQSRASDVATRDISVFRIDFQRDQSPAGPHSAREPDRAVTAQRSELEYRTSVHQLHEKLEQLSLIG